MDKNNKSLDYYNVFRVFNDCIFLVKEWSKIIK